MDILTLAIAKNKSGSANGTITTESITNALGYKPADQEDVSGLDANKAEKTALSQEKTERQAEIAVERARIDNILLSEGSTTGILSGTMDYNNEYEIQKDLDNIKSLGITGINVVVRTELDGNLPVMTQSLDYIRYTVDYAKSIGLEVPIIRLSSSRYRDNTDILEGDAFTEWSAEYYNILVTLADEFSGEIEYFAVMNEHINCYGNINYLDFVKSLTDYAKSKGFKAGISTNTPQQYHTIPQEIVDELDVIMSNLYPKISCKEYMVNADDITEVFNDCSLCLDTISRVNNNKPIMITEFGTRDSFNSLYGHIDNITDTTDGFVQSVYFDGFFNSELAKKCKYCSLWFWETILTDKAKNTLKKYI